MNVATAYEILLCAMVECKSRPIDTPEVLAALQALEPLGHTDQFRENLAGAGSQKQQQALAIVMARIGRRALESLNNQRDKLVARSKDVAVQGRADEIKDIDQQILKVKDVMNRLIIEIRR